LKTQAKLRLESYISNLKFYNFVWDQRNIHSAKLKAEISIERIKLKFQIVKLNSTFKSDTTEINDQ